MKVLWISISASSSESSGLSTASCEMICVGPVPLIWLPNLEVLLGAAQVMLQGRDVVTLLGESDAELILGLFQKIANLHPRVDSPKRWGFPVNQLEAGQIEKLFAQDGEIHDLNKIRPLDDESGELDEFPPFSSDDLLDNWLADLTCSFQGNYSEALALVAGRDLKSVTAISRRLGDLWLGKEKREERGLKRWFKGWEKGNQNLIDEALFGSAT